MLLPKIRLLDGEDAAIVECAVIRESEKNWTVKPLSPKYLDPEASTGNLAFTADWWRVSKSDSSVEKMEGTFDTTQLAAQPHASFMAYINRHENSLFYRIRRGLGELMTMAEENLDGRSNDSPVSGILNQRCSIALPERLDIITSEIILTGATGMSAENRLNGAGYKLFTAYSVGMDGDEDRVRMRLGGDQVNLYPIFNARANARLVELGLQEEI